MCGIGGWIGPQSPAAATRCAARMAAGLAHRGPDGSAWYHDPWVSLVHTRLSIIDPHGGTQPLCNEDGSLWLACNGEIFNYLELRDELRRRGHRFRTGSDCEVMLHLYEEEGLDFVHRLNGQFACCLWDTRRQRALLVRDRLGIAPLFYAQRDGALLFASEVKALLAAAQERATMDPLGLQQILAFWAPVAPRTVFRDVWELPPGEMLIWEAGSQRRHRYWDVGFPPAGELLRPPLAEAEARVRGLLEDATRLRMRADVPVGAYVSGGLDSAVVASLAHRHGSAQLDSFSLSFPEESLDESPYQQAVVAGLGSRYHRVSCGAADILQQLEATVWHAETPLIRSAPVPLGLLSGRVQEQDLRVVLTGEGADEVFGGYDLFKELKLRQFWARQPNSRWRPLLLKRLYPYLRLPQGGGQDYLARFFGSGLAQPDHWLFSHWPRLQTTARLREFLSLELLDAMAGPAEAELERQLPADFQHWAPFCRAQYLEMKTLLPGYLLSTQGDRMLMRHGVEGRFPFLDHRLVEYLADLDPRLKMRVLEEKFLLKRAMSDQVPAAVLDRYKQPYRAPMAEMFRADGELVRGLLSRARLREYGYFDASKVGLLLKKLASARMLGYKDNMALVLMLSTHCWHRRFVAGPCPFAGAAQAPRRVGVAGQIGADAC